MRPQLKHPSIAREKGAPEKGAVLVLFAILVFGFMAIAALCIDMGMATLTQSQMQTAVDTAALEGVRLRDFYEYRDGSDYFRRPRISELVRDVMDDDFHPTRGMTPANVNLPPIPPDDPDALHLGSGPILRVGGGHGRTNWSAQWHVPGNAEYTDDEIEVDDPKLQSNRRNLPPGDMVSGTYHAFESHKEDSNYTRPDYVPATYVPGPNSTSSYRALSFLVRLRRTNDEFHLDHADNVSSGGPVLPYLFGLGTTIHAADPSTEVDPYNPRLEGLTVRGTAIASGVPAMSIGPAPRNADGTRIPDRVATEFGISGRRVLGVAPIALAKSFWIQDVPEYSEDGLAGLKIRADSTATQTPTPDAIYFDRNPLDPIEEIVGTYIDVQGTAWVGQKVQATTQQHFEDGDWYFPIYASIQDAPSVTSKRIIGFGYGRLSLQPASPPANPVASLTIVKGFLVTDSDQRYCEMVVAPDNASSVAPLRYRSDSSEEQLTKDQWTQVLAQLIDFTYPAGVVSYQWEDVRPGTVLAPALTR